MTSLVPARRGWVAKGTFQIQLTVREIVVNGLLATALIPTALRWRFLRAAGVDVERSGIAPHLWLGSRRVSIGEGTFINYGVRIDGQTTIGRNCAIGYEAFFCCTTHELGAGSRRAAAAIRQPVVVGDGSWVGARAMILPGVSIGEGCVIAAGAVVNKDCEPHGLYAGVPAKRVKDLPR